MTWAVKKGSESNAHRERLDVLDTFSVVCVAIGVGLRSLWLGKRELWYDEVLSVLMASGQKSAYKLPEDVPFSLQTFSGLLAVSPMQNIADSIESVIRGTTGDAHPPLFYLSAHVWMRLFGSSEIALRSLVLLISLATLWLGYELGRRVLGRRGGLIFTALFSLNPFFFAHSLNLRMYAPMVFWVMVSGGCFFVLIGEGEALEEMPATGWRRWFLRGGVAIAITAGLLTQYLFAYWLFALAALALYLDRKRWFAHGLTLGAGVLMFVPWALWGVRQQINNRSDVFNQISSAGGLWQSALQHGKDLAQTLANHLLLGHLTTGMLPVEAAIKPTAVVVGLGVIGFLAVCISGLYRRRQYRVLMISLLMGFVPLAVALMADVLANKYTLGFGWGRSTIVALPGCLLLIAAWLTLGTGRWRSAFTAGLLSVYLLLIVGDFGWRDRQIFHQVNHELLKTDEPTLVVMNSRAWGNVLRAVHYLEASANADMLATDPADVSLALTQALNRKNYERVLWLSADYPVWGEPKTKQDAVRLIGETEALLASRYVLKDERVLRGTMDIDRFELKTYE
ncbi:MAG: hypothetical protein DCF25_10245 [Leptolyngbya foveolarum]|uniref:Glycosyltransferase RgtA/B/C/D-like domain-containing protein n=1 Tax=Leptolyngbya foveolarum TaxID=47253 RepID=A0A2W4UBB3_9CYAN|nr:MAG: hypothetical protein DCF25_10245 [Leptolyngbya foveolarum]